MLTSILHFVTNAAVNSVIGLEQDLSLPSVVVSGNKHLAIGSHQFYCMIKLSLLKYSSLQANVCP